MKDNIAKEITYGMLWDEAPEKDKQLVLTIISNAIDFGVYTGTVNTTWQEEGFDNHFFIQSAFMEYISHARISGDMHSYIANYIITTQNYFNQYILPGCVLDDFVPTPLSNKYLKQLIKRRKQLLQDLR